MLAGRFTVTLTGTTLRETFRIAVFRNPSMSSKTLSGGASGTNLISVFFISSAILFSFGLGYR